MKILLPSAATIAEAVTILKSGGVIVHATETCYGFACDLTNPTAVARLFAIKHRPPTQPVSTLCASLTEAKLYVEWNERAEELAAQHLPGPLTLILPMRTDARRLYAIPGGGARTLGIRVSSHPLAHGLVSGFGGPLSTTSANIHGEPNPYSALSIAERFAKETLQPDLIIDSGELPPTPPSTVIDLTGPERMVRGERKV